MRRGSRRTRDTDATVHIYDARACDIMGFTPMPEIVDDTVKEGRAALAPGAKYWIGRSLGGAVAGPIGTGVGGVAAAAHVGGSTGNALAALAVNEALDGLFTGGSGGNTGGGTF